MHVVGPALHGVRPGQAEQVEDGGAEVRECDVPRAAGRGRVEQPGPDARRPQRRHREVDAVGGVGRAGHDHGVLRRVDLGEHPADQAVGRLQGLAGQRAVVGQPVEREGPAEGGQPGQVRRLEQDDRPARDVPG